MTTTNPQETQPTLTMTAEQLFERHPLPWSHHLLLIKDANGRQVIHTGGLYGEHNKSLEESYLSGLNALFVSLVNTRVRDSAAATVDYGALHWQLRAGAEETMCGRLAKDVRHTVLQDFATCETCKAAAFGYQMGRTDKRAASPVAPRDEQCPVTCADFSMHTCSLPHRCVLDAGHPFDPSHGSIHEFEAHQTTVQPRKVVEAAPSSPPPRELAQKAATEICDWCGIDTNDAERVAEIIERHFSTGRSEPSDPTSASTQVLERP